MNLAPLKEKKMKDVIPKAEEEKEIPLYKLLRVGDDCEVYDRGVTYNGVVRNIIRLSNGKTLFSVDLCNNPVKSWDLYIHDKVAPRDAVQRMLRMTTIDMLLKKYEPTGQSTNVSLW